MKVIDDINMAQITKDKLYSSVREILITAQATVQRSINSAMVEAT